LEEVGEEAAALAEDAAQHFWDSEDKLAVRDGVADAGGDPFGGLAGAALVAGGADVAGFAGEGEEALVTAVGAVVAGEAGGEVATAVVLKTEMAEGESAAVIGPTRLPASRVASPFRCNRCEPESLVEPSTTPSSSLSIPVSRVVGLDGGDGFRTEGTHGGLVVFLVSGEEVIPGGVDDLPKWGGAGAAWLVDGRHNCSLEQLWHMRCFTVDKSHSGECAYGALRGGEWVRLSKGPRRSSSLRAPVP
jgi:hypothetical protein